MARDFSGSDQYLIKSSTPVTAVPLTMAGWFKYDSVIADDAEHTVMSITQTGNFNEFTIEIGRTGGANYAIAMVNFGNTTFGFALSTIPPIINTWHHVCGVFTSATSRTVYLDGGNSGTDTTNATPIGLNALTIGAVSNATGIVKDFNGSLAEIGLWNRVLTATEIGQLAAGYAPSFIPAGLSAYISNRGQNNPEIDAKSTTPFTVNGATKIAHPDFIKYPGRSEVGKILRPRSFAPGIAK